MKPGYTLQVNAYRPRGVTSYSIKIKNSNNREAARLVFSIDRKEMSINNGETFVYNNVNLRSYRGQGFGTFLRALATKAGSIANKNTGKHLGLYTNTKSKKLGTPASTRILPPGWKAKEIYNNGQWSLYNYKKENIAKVNALIKKIVNGWKA